MKFLAPLLIFPLLISCKSPVDNNEEIAKPTISIAKWYNNHTAAISITHDDPSPHGTQDQEAQAYLKKYSLVMDYELVTKSYPMAALDYLKKEMETNTLSYFGHGNTHDGHDAMSYDEAYFSFKACFDSLTNWNLEPIAYAYPFGSGRQSETQRALKDAGFLSGRAFTADNEDVPSFHIMPNSETEPENWFLLPTLRMEEIEFNNNEKMINDNEELLPILQESIELGSWIILTYHAIGCTDGWGYTSMENFVKNCESIAEYDFWNASMNDITIYSYERKNAQILFESNSDDYSEFSITISDGFYDPRFDHPLTLVLSDIDTNYYGQYQISREPSIIDTISISSNSTQINLNPDESTYIFKKL